jgi:hypothetical protein
MSDRSTVENRLTPEFPPVLPYIFFDQTASAYRSQQQFPNDEAKLIGSILVGDLVALLAAAANAKHALAHSSQIAGVLPFIALPVMRRNPEGDPCSD